VKLYLFLRSIVWTSVLAVVSAVSSVVAAFTYPDLAIPFGLVAITMAILSPRKNEY
jgi:hypothetical protein